MFRAILALKSSKRFANYLIWVILGNLGSIWVLKVCKFGTYQSINQLINQSKVLELLLKHGCEVDALDMIHMTPLHWAVERNQPESMEVLLKYGASPETRSKFDKTPLEIASDNGRPGTVALVVELESRLNLERFCNFYLAYLGVATPHRNVLALICGQFVFTKSFLISISSRNL